MGVLQIQKIRNVTAPKVNEESNLAPRMLKLTLTDGHVTCYALEILRISQLSLNTPPGTKIKLQGESIPVSHGHMLLSSSNVKVIGGKVDELIEKWEFSKEVPHYARTAAGRADGPPPFVPFGKKINVGGVDESKKKSFKSLGQKDKEIKEDDAGFQQQRQATIAEAAKAKSEGKTKKFTGGGPQDKMSLVNKAVSTGSGPPEKQEISSRNWMQDQDRSSNRGKPRKGRGKDDESEIETGLSRPSGPTTLFDFLEQKMPSKADKREEKSSASGTRSDSIGQKCVQSSDYHQLSSNTFKSTSYGQKSDGTQYQKQEYKRNTFDKSRSKPDRRGTQRNDLRKEQYLDGCQTEQDRHSERKEFYRNESRGNTSQRYNKQERNTNSTRRDNSDRYSGKMFDQRNQVHEDNKRKDTSQPERRYDTYSDRRQYDEQTDRKKYNSKKEQRHQRSQDIRYQSNRGDSSYSTGQSGANPSVLPSEKSLTDQFNSISLSSNDSSSKTINSRKQDRSADVQDSSSLFLQNPSKPQWKPSDHCLARYWEDGKFYNALIHAVSENGSTAVVQFTDYGNYEEIFLTDILPVPSEPVTASGTGMPSMVFVSNDCIMPSVPPFPMDLAALEQQAFNQRRSQQRPSMPLYQPPSRRQ